MVPNVMHRPLTTFDVVHIGMRLVHIPKIHGMKIPRRVIHRRQWFRWATGWTILTYLSTVMITRPHIDALPAEAEIANEAKNQHMNSARESLIPVGFSTQPKKRNMQAVRSRTVWCVMNALMLLERESLLKTIASRTYPLARNPTTAIVQVAALKAIMSVGETQYGEI